MARGWEGVPPLAGRRGRGCGGLEERRAGQDGARGRSVSTPRPFPLAGSSHATAPCGWGGVPVFVENDRGQRAQDAFLGLSAVWAHIDLGAQAAVPLRCLRAAVRAGPCQKFRR
eukprot:8673893-Pyramimonas_sp.AAC.1